MGSWTLSCKKEKRNLKDVNGQNQYKLWLKNRWNSFGPKISGNYLEGYTLKPDPDKNSRYEYTVFY